MHVERSPRPPVRILSWNINCFTPARTADKARLLAECEWDIALLQEVTRPAFHELCEAFATEVVGVTALELHEVTDHRQPLGCAILVRRPLAIESVDLVPGQPRMERALSAVVRHDDTSIRVCSWHAPNRAGQGLDTKMAGYRSMHDWATACEEPLIVGLDTNSWHDPIDPVDADPTHEHYAEHRFLSRDPGHDLRDAYRIHLSSRPSELARIRRLRPDGPLAITYNRGRDNRPKVNRFDLVMVSPHFDVVSVEHHYAEALSAGSDHAVVTAALQLNTEASA